MDATALLVLPDPDLLDRRPGVVGRRPRPDRRRGRHSARRLRDRPTLPLPTGRADRRARGDAEPVPRLARRARQPRDPRRAARGARRLPDAAGHRANGKARARGAGSPRRRARPRDPRQLAARPAAARRRRLRRLAAPALRACADRRGRLRALAPPVARAKRRQRRLLRDHDGRPGIVEGQQPEHIRRARSRRLDRRRAEPRRRASLARARGRPDAGRHADDGRRVRADAALPARGARFLARPSAREGAPRRAGGAHALGPALDPDRGQGGGGRVRRRRADVGATAIHDPAVPPRAARAVRDPTADRGALPRAARVQHARRARFAGATRYRVPWDFLLALSAGAAVVWLLERWRARELRR